MTTTASIACPWCGRLNDCHDNTTGKGGPKPGDVTLCWGCARPSFYEATAFGVMTQRKATEEEAEALSQDPIIRGAYLAIMTAALEGLTPAEVVAHLRQSRG